MIKRVEKRCYVKVHKRGEDIVVAACDEELLGKTIHHMGVEIEIKPEFYRGKLIPLSQLNSYIKKGTVINLIGKDVVSEASKINPLLEIAAVEIGGIPHVQIVSVKHE